LIPYGSPGESIEIYEKINPETGKGVVVMFGKGQIEYVTKSKVDLKTWKSDAVTLEIDSKGRAVIKTVFDETSAKIVFFGVQ
jgi:hypothetical protein